VLLHCYLGVLTTLKVPRVLLPTRITARAHQDLPDSRVVVLRAPINTGLSITGAQNPGGTMNAIGEIMRVLLKFIKPCNVFAGANKA